MFLLFCLFILFLLFSFLEYNLHKKNIDKIPIRIQVNGTRGKSSVTRLIAAGLRGGGKRVIAKTTGTKPRFIISNREEVPITRLGKANIQEDISIFRKAIQNKPDALVIECMALVPQYQEIEAKKLVKPNYGVITNCRADHLDVMGPTVRDVALALSSTIPEKGVFFTAEKEYFLLLKSIADKRGTKTLFPEIEITDEDMKGFSYLEHKENVALALLVCSNFGVSKEDALRGMKEANPDPGVLRIWTIEKQGKKIELVNTLAANDPDSIGLLWEKVQDRKPERIVLVNCRSDRADRSIQLAELVAKKFDANFYVATGFLTQPFIRKAINSGIGREKLIDLGNKSVESIYKKIWELVKSDCLVFATGNIVGFGETLIQYFARFGTENAY